MRAVMPWRAGTETWLEPFRREMNEMFRRFWPEPREEAGELAFPAWTPRADVEETEEALTVKLDVPGVNPEEVEIFVSEGRLILRGERKEEHEEKGKVFHRTERFVGQFYREIALPEGADPEHIEATSAKGVLTVRVPKKPEAKPKKIPVKATE
jgi:HSP20 family protein